MRGVNGPDTGRAARCTSAPPSRIYEFFLATALGAVGDMRPAGSNFGVRIIAFITDAVVVRDIHAHLGEVRSPSRLMPAHN